MKNFFKTKYRIVPDRFWGYEVQFRYWWMPFYVQCRGCNTHPTLESAKREIVWHKGVPLYEE